MNNSKKCICALLSFIMIISLSSAAFAAKSVDQLKKEMQERSESIKKTEKEINSKQAEKNEEIKKRNRLDLQISAMLDDIEATESVINEKEEEISLKNAEIEELSNQIETNNNKLKSRLKAIYEYGSTSYLDMILNANGLADFVTRLSVVKQIYSYDKKVIGEYIQSKKKVEQAKEIIVTQQKEQIEAKRILENKKSSLESLKSEKQAIIDNLNGDIAELEKQEKQKEADYAALQKELQEALSGKSASSQPAYTGSGQFAWPSATSTRITSYYGYRPHPISGVRKLHRGIDIGAGLGTNVLAAESGTVTTAGWNNSYGYYITINHGSSLVTLYAHNSKLLVSKGDKVQKGQVIAKCGSTGNSTGPHIHFEVSKNGQLQNPMNYLK